MRSRELTSRRSRWNGFAVVCAVLCLLTGCGGGGSGGGAAPDLPEPTLFEGSIVNRSGEPLSDVEVYIYETYEGSITDERGEFSIQSTSHLGSAHLFFKQTTYTNKVNLGSIPDTAASVVAGIMIDPVAGSAELIGVSFDGSAPPGVDPDPETPSAPTPAPGSTPHPTPTATPKPEIFDPKGNTSSFGIPGGMKGNISAGAQVWKIDCASCHAVEKTGRTFGQIKGAYRIVPSMQPLSITPQRIADVTAYLNRNRK